MYTKNTLKYLLALVFGFISFLSISSYGQTYSVTTFAGSGTANSTDGIGTAASFNSPQGVAVDSLGNLYIADPVSHLIRKISASGVVTTLAGSISGYVDGTGTSARFSSPSGVAVDRAGNVYVADQNNNRIRKVSSEGVVTTLAGSSRGFANGTGTAAKFFGPVGVAVDADGYVYVADANNHRIRKISPTGDVTTLAGSAFGYQDGTGTTARFFSPSGVSVDNDGNVFVADHSNQRIRKINPEGMVTTIAGSGVGGYSDGTGAMASFNNPNGLAIDGNGNIFVADKLNHRIRKISPSGEVTTFAGSGTSGFADSLANLARFNGPYNVAIDGSGNVYVADAANRRIRKVSLACTPPATPTISGTNTFCAGGSTVLTSSAATGNLWSTGATTQSITVTSAGDYSVRVIDGTCTSEVSSTVAVSVTPLPTAPTISGNNTFCTGSSTILTSSAATGNLWSTGATTQSITVTSAGDYSVSVVSGICTSASSESVRVNVSATPNVPQILGSNYTCSETETGYTTLTTNNNPSLGNIIWSTGHAGPNLVVTQSGTYSARSYSGNCTSAVSESFTVTVRPTPVTPTITSAGNTICSGSSAILTSSPAESYLWSTGETTQSISVSQTNNYFVRTSVGGCQSQPSNSIRVHVNDTPNTPTITGNRFICLGGSTVLTSSSDIGNIWSNGSIMQSITVTEPGNYSVFVVFNGCTSAVSEVITVTELSAIPAPTITGSDAICGGVPTILTSSAPTGNLWSTGETTQSIAVSTFASYSVRVINGTCTSAVSNFITPTIRAAVATPFIEVGFDGETSVNVCQGETVEINSATFYNQYIWSNGATSRSINVGESGVYTVRGINNGCTSAISNSISVTMVNRPAPRVIESSAGLQICTGETTTLSFSTTDLDPAITPNFALIDIRNGFLSIPAVVGPGRYIAVTTSSSSSCIVFSDTIEISSIACQNVFTGTGTFGNNSNWSTNAAPLSTENAVIDGIATLTGNVTVNNLTVNAGRSIEIPSGLTLTVTGNVSNLGTISGEGTLRLGGTNLQTFGGGTISNLLIENSDTAKQVAITRITNELRLGNNQVLNLNSIRLTLISDMNGTARVAAVPSSSSIINRSSFNQQRWLDRNNVRSTSTGNTGNYYLIGPVVQGQRIDYWNSVTPYNSSTYAPSSGTGNVYLMQPSTGNWIKPNAPSQPINSGMGAQVWFGINYFFAGANNTLSMVGSPVVGNYNFPITSEQGYHLVSNPYPSTIDWDSPDWIRNNINNAIYNYDWVAQTYITYVNGIGVNGGTRYIATAQGFLVFANNNAPVLTATENIKVSNQVAMQRTESNVNGLIRLAINNNGVTDEMVIANRNTATLAFEADQDAQKMMNPTTNIYVSGSVNQSIASMNLNGVNSIPFVLQTNRTGEVSLGTTELIGLEGYTLNLFNEQTGELLPYTGSETYTFSVTANQPYRLQLRVGSVTGINTFKASAFEVFPNPATDKVTIRTNGTGTLEVLNVVGRVVISQPASETNEINVSKLAKGVYTVKFNGASQKLVVK